MALNGRFFPETDPSISTINIYTKTYRVKAQIPIRKYWDNIPINFRKSMFSTNVGAQIKFLCNVLKLHLSVLLRYLKFTITFKTTEKRLKFELPSKRKGQ